MFSRYSILILVTFFLLGACRQSVRNQVNEVVVGDTIPQATTKVVLLVVDGPRFVDTWGDVLHTHIPFQSHLAEEGVFFSSFYNDGETYTIPGHSAIITGIYENLKNDGSEVPHNPSMFQYYRAASHSAPTDACIITSKSKLKVLGNCVDNIWKDNYLPSVDTEDRPDSVTLRIALKILQDNHPTLSLIHFRGPDVKGHSNDWEGYLKSIEETDQYVNDVWGFIQTNGFYHDKTALLVTNDHGRHLDGIGKGFVTHGDQCEGCRHISLLALGPDFAQGKVVKSYYGQIDIAPTIATLLNFYWDGEGRVIEELINTDIKGK